MNEFSSDVLHRVLFIWLAVTPVGRDDAYQVTVKLFPPVLVLKLQISFPVRNAAAVVSGRVPRDQGPPAGTTQRDRAVLSPLPRRGSGAARRGIHSVGAPI